MRVLLPLLTAVLNIMGQCPSYKPLSNGTIITPCRALFDVVVTVVLFCFVVVFFFGGGGSCFIFYSIRKKLSLDLVF